MPSSSARRSRRTQLTRAEEANATGWALTWAANGIQADLENPAEHAYRVAKLGEAGAAVAEARMKRAMERLRANAATVFRRSCDRL